jgi:hypothetical protein
LPKITLYTERVCKCVCKQDMAHGQLYTIGPLK